MEHGLRDLFSCQDLQKVEIRSTIGTCGAWSGSVWIPESLKKPQIPALPAPDFRFPQSPREPARAGSVEQPAAWPWAVALAHVHCGHLQAARVASGHSWKEVRSGTPS